MKHRELLSKAASPEGVSKPTIISRRGGGFLVRLPGRAEWEMRPHESGSTYAFTYEEALARVAAYYEEVGRRQHRLGSLGLGALGA